MPRRALETDTVMRDAVAFFKKSAIAFSVFAVFAPLAAFAQVDVGLDAAQSIGLSTVSLPELVGRIIYAFLGLLGIIAVVLVIYAGFIWMTAQGSEEKIKKAKQILTNAVIGLVIIMSAGAITMFILNALIEATEGGSGAGGASNSARLFALSSGTRGSALGNGIVEYHYPEPGQIDVPRNTKISVTFKKPLVLSSVFRNYDDKGTYATTDDEVCPAAPPCTGGVAVTADTILNLNTDNIRITTAAGMREAGSGTGDEQFARHYPDAATLVEPAPTAKVTAVTADFSAPQTQTIVIKPVSPIGSPTANVNYRVAMRGGESGIKVWDETSTLANPESQAAFVNAYGDGGYYWAFETNTTIDVMPPRIVAVIPDTTVTPGQPSSSVLDRNQLLQIYFNEAVDPTTASGIMGAGGGFNLVEVRAQCLPDTYPGSCEFNAGQPGIIAGALALGNRYRTAEFTPSQPCEGVSENSCGEPVYCLPRNVLLEVVAKAATIDTQAPIDPEPPAALVDNGVEDMVGNSLDGNGDGVAQGPQAAPEGSQPGGRADAYDLNQQPTVTASMSDTAFWQYHVGSNIDLTVPVLLAVDPPPLPPEITEYPDGPSKVPVTTIITMTWSKIMSISSLRTGSFDEVGGDYLDPYSTVVLRARECLKSSNEACTAADCPCANLAPPGFFLGGLPTDVPADTMLVADPDGNGRKVTRVALLHPVSPFMTANDLGYTEEDIAVAPGNVPAYLPIARAKIRDTKQNCFWPSRYEPADGSARCTLGPGQNSCCNRIGETDASFFANCAPQPSSP